MSASNVTIQSVTEAGIAGDHDSMLAILATMPTDARDRVCSSAISWIGKQGKLEAVQLLLSSISDPKLWERCCGDAISWAAAANRPEMVTQFISQIPNLQLRSDALRHAVCGAAMGGQVDLVRRFLSDIATPDTRDQACSNAQFWAINGKHWEAAECIASAASKPELRRSLAYQGALSAAKYEAWPAASQIFELIEETSYRDKWCAAALQVAVNSSNQVVLDWLLSEFSDGSESKQTACSQSLPTAVRKCELELIEKLVENISDSQTRLNACLEAIDGAVNRGRWELVSYLVNASSDQEDEKDSCRAKVALLAADLDSENHLVTYLSAISNTGVRDLCCLQIATLVSKKSIRKLVTVVAGFASNSSVSNQCRRKAASFAASMGDWEVLKSALDSIDDPELTENSTTEDLSTAINEGQWQIVEQLMLSYSRLVPNLSNPLVVGFLANEASNNRLTVVNLLAKRQTSEANRDLMFQAIALGHVSLSAALLMHLEDINSRNHSDCTALMLAAERGQDELISLIASCPGVQFELQDSRGFTALSMACAGGHARAVKRLIESGANANHRDLRGRSCSDLARETAQSEVLNVLQLLDRSSDSEDSNLELSLALHRILNDAGFVRGRVMFQWHMAHFLQKIAVALTQEDREMTGSYAEGWGNSLVQVNGKTAADSDIDWTIMLGKQEFHLEGGCSCREDSLRIPVIEGHAQLSVSAGNQPALATPQCGVRPATDTCYAYPCCSPYCVDRVKLLSPFYKLFSPTIHLVRATRPNYTNELRVSFSFVEKAILRDMGTVQGQLFILLKYVMKRLLPKVWSTPGLKTYNAKTLIFFMLERKEAHITEKGKIKDWNPESLISLVREALDLMLEFLDKDPRPSVCMPHFFMPGAPLFFKNAELGPQSDSTKSKVRERLSYLRHNLGDLLQLVGDHMKPLESPSFYFHPFTLLPLVDLKTSPAADSNDKLPYAVVYISIHWCISALQSPDCPSLDQLLGKLSRLPIWCRTATLCLGLMSYLKLGHCGTARTIALENLDHRVQRGWECSKEKGFFYNFYSGGDPPDTDWAWRFCFAQGENANFSFLSEFCQSLLSVRGIGTVSAHLYVNFRSLWWALLAELLPAQSLELLWTGWREELKDDPDLEELLTVARYSAQADQLEECQSLMLAISTGRSLEACDVDKLSYVESKIKNSRSP